MRLSSKHTQASKAPDGMERENPMQIKILWVVLLVTNLAWFIAFRVVDKGRVNEIAQHQLAEQQRDACQSQVGKLTDTMNKLCACGGK